MATGFEPETHQNQTGMVHRMAKVWTEGTQWAQGQCRVCGANLSYAGTDDLPVTVCETCEPLADDHYATEQIAITRKWEDECPALYRKMILRDIDPHYIDEAALEKVAKWHPKDRTGLILVGNSGTGKTLALWALKRNLMKDGIRCDFYSAVEIARELSRHAKNLDVAVHLWNTRVLMIDDLGKEPVTPAASALFWELIDRRYQHQVPTIITTRFRGEGFSERFREPALGTDIRRRIKDTCKPVQFSGGQS